MIPKMNLLNRTIPKIDENAIKVAEPLNHLPYRSSGPSLRNYSTAASNRLVFASISP
jgi:hypothetical protein